MSRVVERVTGGWRWRARCACGAVVLCCAGQQARRLRWTRASRCPLRRLDLVAARLPPPPPPFLRIQGRCRPLPLVLFAQVRLISPTFRRQLPPAPSPDARRRRRPASAAGASSMQRARRAGELGCGSAGREKARGWRAACSLEVVRAGRQRSAELAPSSDRREPIALLLSHATLEPLPGQLRTSRR